MPTYTGTSGADSFAAPDNQDWLILGKGGADTLVGGGGNDIFDAGKGNDILNGGGGNDTFLVGVLGGTDVYDGGDSAYVGADGYDVVKAIADNVKIGIVSFTGIEEFSADGHVGVSILGSAGDNVFDFSLVKLTGITLVSGGAGNDTITGNATTGTVIDGGTGNDVLIGGTGNDTFLVGKNAGVDSFAGGDGFDTILATSDGAHIGLGSVTGIEEISGDTYANVMIDGTSGDDYMYFAKTVLTNIAAVHAGDGNDKIIGSTGDDILYGDAGDDIINGGAGSDSLYGGKGHDILSGGAGDDSFYMSSGDDLYKGGAGYDVIYATKNGDSVALDQGLLSSIEEINANGFAGVTITGANSDGSLIDLRHIVINDGDIAGINGTNGNDTIYGSQVFDLIKGGLGDDLLNGFNGDDEIHGGGGADTLIGGNGFDLLYGDIGNDTLNGGAGDDILFGGTGDDILIASANGGFDEFHGDKGFDTIVAGLGVKMINIGKLDGIEAISSDGTHSAFIHGTTGDDIFDFSAVTFSGISGIFADDGNDIVTGTAGNDTINGEAGDDTLVGGLGTDVISGGVGLDTLTGGGDGDIFKDKAIWLNGDRIIDFSVGDSIDIIDAKDPTKLVLSYVADTSGLSGTLHVAGLTGIKAGIDIHLDGAFTLANFQVASDGVHGSLVNFVSDIPMI